MTTLRFAALLATVLMLAACSRVTAENYNKLKTGQSYDEVRTLLGEPARCDETLGLRACRWGDDKSFIVVNFVGSKAVLFSAENVH